MYAFEDKGGRAIALRPELTAPVLRMYVNEARVLPKPLRWYYVDDCFRYERPQKGRYRQFWQFGAELIGVDSAGADAEVILLADAALRAAGVEYELKVGHLALLRSLLADLDEGARRTVMGLLDKREMNGLADALAALERTDLLPRLEALVNAATLDEAFDVTGPLPEEARLRELVALLDATGLAYSLNFGIVRGLDYYTGMVFEGFAANLGAENQIVGGGAYRLAHLFGGEDTPSCGFAIGFDRVMVALGEVAVPHRTVVAVLSTPEGAASACRAAAAFRAAGLRADLDLSGKGLGRADDEGREDGRLRRPDRRARGRGGRGRVQGPRDRPPGDARARGGRGAGGGTGGGRTWPSLRSSRGSSARSRSRSSSRRTSTCSASTRPSAA